MLEIPGALARAQDVELPEPAAPPNPARPPCILVDAGVRHEPRWRPGERLHHLFEATCDRLQAAGQAGRPAVDAGDVVVTYGDLDARANRLARYLRAQCAQPGDRIGLMFDQAVPAYVAMLAVLKINAVYVPLDAGFPADRLSYIVEDAGVRCLLSLAPLRDRLAHLPVALICLDEAEAAIAPLPAHRLTATEAGEPAGELCYVIYTSGSTGRPKGVAISQAAICNFVRVAAETYGIQPEDRVYQGMTIAFDFSVEEIWVAWIVGATLVPKPPGPNLLGQDLWEFLDAQAVTALCCVPTVLATLDQDLPGLRFLLVSGEACPQELIARWHRPGRRFLNVYGPTEATVTATWSVVDPGKPVTIGSPLPTYSVVILDPAEPRALPLGETGEIGIAGIGLADGYLNRDDLTDRAFIPDDIGIPHNPGGRIYRTGDLGRINADGAIEYHGRIDTQIKIRGYRIELTEIESALLQVEGIAQAVVATVEPEPGLVELAGYYTLQNDVPALDHGRVFTELRQSLPRYMVPSFLEQLDSIPMLAGGKADRKRLPRPKGPRSLATQRPGTAPATPMETALADLLAQALHLGQFSVDHHFFDELGANSLLMAQFCARVRERPDLPSVAMKDIYLHPTVRELAAVLEQRAPVTPMRRKEEPAPVVGTGRYLLCGTLQLLFLLGASFLGMIVAINGYEWISAADGWADLYLRAALFGDTLFLAMCLLPIMVKWSLIGRWQRGEIPIWSLGYLRFWIVRTMIRTSPMAMFPGSPLYVLYLRALGARIGKNVVILSQNVPVCTDLLSIGDGTIIRKDTFFNGYRAHAGRIQIGRVSLGRGVFVGEHSVIDIDSSMGDQTQLGHASSLHPGQSVPDGERWHGCPARPAEVDYQRVTLAECSALRRVGYGTVQLLVVLSVSAPLGVAGLTMLLDHLPLLESVRAQEMSSYDSWSFYGSWLLVSFAGFFGAVLGGLIVVGTVPRLLTLLLTPGKVYPLFGIHFVIQRLIQQISNQKFYTELFGDSSYIVHYLRLIGYDLSTVEQTGTNFGTEVKQEIPGLCAVGQGTMVSDGLSILNADYSSSSFRVSPVSLGAHSFLGNDVVYPAGGRTGDNCLLGTKVLIPLDGPVREGVGLLGSPCFEIPRSVTRDHRFDHLKAADELPRRLRAKNRYNIATMAVFLLVRWLHVYGVTLISVIGLDLYFSYGAAPLGLVPCAFLLFSIAYFALIERASTGFRGLAPRFCSIYEPYFWWHERYWKLLMPPFAMEPFNGTPFKILIWRLLGVQMGKRVLDEGAGIPEGTLLAVGDDCVINVGTTIQGHSLEDGTFKSNRIMIGSGCTIGVGGFVHYGVTMEDGAVLDAGSFLMKGEVVASGSTWLGNPAREVVDAAQVPEACGAAPDPRPANSVAPAHPTQRAA
ncbi:Pls/PosA family non-ribosomal peptide synthetase [Geminicoccus harenae]|uniref:Pls/PosA family non-ribosomal peptide synthetase n=1 Tax=Geminicoccus harenae TaxID=2498453 RepID=UPI00168B59A7|nr:Pls/PosA family non-ribosomal peptide synthetase [Geminicoccus harenae]